MDCHYNTGGVSSEYGRGEEEESRQRGLLFPSCLAVDAAHCRVVAGAERRPQLQQEAKRLIWQRAKPNLPASFSFLFSNVREVLSNRRCFVAEALLMFSLCLNLSYKHFLSVGVAPPLGPSNGTTATTQRIPGLVRKHPSGVVSLHPFVFVHRCVLAHCSAGAAFFAKRERLGG